VRPDAETWDKRMIGVADVMTVDLRGLGRAAAGSME
jgi:hypothetical protein